jgi:hypothetical protein
MSMPMNTGSLAKLLYPGVNTFFMTKYNEYDDKYTSLFDVFDSKRNFEEDVALSNFGLMLAKSEMAPITYDTMRQGWTARYTHVTYGLGFQVSRELVEDNMYKEVSLKKASMLAMSARQTKEIIAANVYNRAFNTSYTGGDGKALLVSDHPNITGGTYSNILATAANLSEAAVEQALIDIRKYVDDRGNRINATPLSLILPVDLEFEAERIFKSTGRVGTPNNDINALKSIGRFPKGIVLNPFLTSTTAWFIRTDVSDGMKHFKRRAMEFATDNDFDTENAKFKCTERYSFGWTDPKGLYGTAGV